MVNRKGDCEGKIPPVWFYTSTNFMQQQYIIVVRNLDSLADCSAKCGSITGVSTTSRKLSLCASISSSEHWL